MEEGKSNTDLSWTVRLLAKLLLRARELWGKESLRWLELIEHTSRNLLAEAVKSLAQFKHSEEGIGVERPNIGIKCGQGVCGLIAAAEGHALQLDDDFQLAKTKKMFLNYDKEWLKLRNACRQSLKSKKEDKDDLLPLTLKAPPIICSRRQVKILPLFQKTNKYGIFHENRLLADDSPVISYLIFVENWERCHKICRLLQL